MSWLLQTMFKKIFFKQCFIPKMSEEITGQTLSLANVNSRILTLIEYQCTWKRIQNKHQNFLTKKFDFENKNQNITIVCFNFIFLCSKY